MNNRRRFFRIPADELIVMVRKVGSKSWVRVSAVDFTRNGLGIVAGDEVFIPGENLLIYLATKDGKNRSRTKIRNLKASVVNAVDHGSFRRYGIKFTDARSRIGKHGHNKLCRIETEISPVPQSADQITDVFAHSRTSELHDEGVADFATLEEGHA